MAVKVSEKNGVDFTPTKNKSGKGVGGGNVDINIPDGPKIEVKSESGEKSAEFGNVKAAASGSATAGLYSGATGGVVATDKGVKASGSAGVGGEASVSGNASIHVGNAKVEAEGSASASVKAGASGSFETTGTGVKASGSAGAKAGAEAHGNISYDNGFTGGGVKGDAFAGARAGAKGGFEFDPPNGEFGAYGSVGGFAGAEASIEPSTRIGPIEASCKLGARAGVGFDIGGSIGTKDGHLVIEIDLGLALGVGFTIKPYIDIDIGAILDFFDWLGGQFSTGGLQSKYGGQFLERDFTQATKAKILKMVKETSTENKGWGSQFVDFLSDNSLTKVTTSISGAMKDLDGYQKGMADLNNTTVAEMEKIFENVYGIDQSYANKFSEATRSVSGIINSVKKISGGMR
jgi:hypothetical protein